MKLKKNNGYVGVDTAIAILILVIMIPTIAGMIYNVNKTNKTIDRRTEALNIAVNTIEVAKGLGIDEMRNSNVTASIMEMLKNQLYSDLNITDNTLTKDSSTYKIDVTISDYADTHTDAIKDFVKIVKVTVTYKPENSQNNQDSIDLSTVIY